MIRMTQQTVTFDDACSLASAQIHLVESKVHRHGERSSQRSLIESVREITAQVELILDSIQSTKLSSQRVEVLLPALTTLGRGMDECLAELKRMNLVLRILWSGRIRKFEQTCDRVDDLVETMRLSQNPQMIEHLKNVLDEAAATA